MKKFIIKLVIFCFPFCLYGLIVILVDPYNYFDVSKLIDNGQKRDISYKLNYCIWKSIEYKRKPLANILLGDSRINGVDVGVVEKYSGEPYYNFAYGGGTLPEAIDTFWYASRLTNLKNVYFGLGFHYFNAFSNRDRFTEAAAINENPFLYFINRNVLLSSYCLLSNYFFGVKGRIGKVSGSKDEFWRHQLDDSASELYGKYRYPDQYYQELEKIEKYCRCKNINLVFIIFPSHVDLQKVVQKYNLIEDHTRFKRDLSKLGDVYDFDFPNVFTRNKNNFGDPFHSYDRNFIVPLVWNHSRLLKGRHSNIMKYLKQQRGLE